jgi:ABC-type proline/glycine betaine transport system permease subunit
MVAVGRGDLVFVEVAEGKEVFVLVGVLVIAAVAVRVAVFLTYCWRRGNFYCCKI